MKGTEMTELEQIKNDAKVLLQRIDKLITKPKFKVGDRIIIDLGNSLIDGFISYISSPENVIYKIICGKHGYYRRESDIVVYPKIPLGYELAELRKRLPKKGEKCQAEDGWVINARKDYKYWILKLSLVGLLEEIVEKSWGWSNIKRMGAFDKIIKGNGKEQR